MKRLTRSIFLLVLFTLAAGSVRSFSLLGLPKITANGYPFDYQIVILGYQLPGDIGTPMTPQEGYRWNIPVLTYAYDQSFFNYFGSNGVAAVEKAIAILNNLPPMSQITNDSAQLYINGQPVPFTPRQINYSAQALGLLDLETTTLHLLVEEMGLAEPERWCFGLRGRAAFTSPAPGFTNYSVIQINYDPISIRPTNAVNAAHYTYEIFDPILNPDHADALEFAVDPLELPWQSVAGFFWTRTLSFVDLSGVFFDGLSHDDVGGLRYLYNTNNLAFESLPPGATYTGGASTGTGGTGTTGTNVSPWLPFLGSTNTFVVTNTFPPWTPWLSQVITNNPGITNVVPGTTNTNSQTFALRGGINKITFQRVAFDSIIGNTFTPITLRWNDTIIGVNGKPAKIPAQRVVTQPDIVFGVQNLGGNVGTFIASRSSTTNWFNNDSLNGTTALGGPGVITPPIRILFTDQMPNLFNQNPGLLFEPPTPAFSSFTWASFDGTTNPPVIYPAFGGFTVEELQSAILNSGN
jgi:hypothetical protein